MEPPLLDGYAVETLVGFGPTGQVWRARAEQTGQMVAVKLLRAPATSTADELLETLSRDAETVTRLDSAHLVPIHKIRLAGEQVVVVTDYVAGDSLDTLLTRRDRLDLAEVITLIAPLAETVAALHLSGLVHGAVTATNVLLAPDGRPMLTDVGVAVAMGSADALPAEDVRALAVLGLAACGIGPDTAPSADPLVRVLSDVAASTPQRLPSARDLASAVLRAGPAAPIRSSAPPRRRAIGDTALLTDRLITAAPRRRLPVDRPTLSEPAVSDRRLTLRRVVVVGSMACALLLGTAAAYAHIRPHSAPTSSPPRPAPPTPTATPTPAPASVSWTAIAQHLDAARAKAFDRSDPKLLLDVYAPHAYGLEADRHTIRRLRHRGLQVIGFTATVSGADLVAATSTSAELRVADRQSAYSLVDRTGDITTKKGRPIRSYLLTLTRTDAGWRVATIS